MTCSDDGISGLTLDRPAFKEMLSNVRQGLINCIIVKDLSRFSRDYIAVGDYTENILPKYNVRLIALTDSIDTADHNNRSSDIHMPLKSILNDHYSKDISIKVRAAFDAKRKAGQFVGAFARYGYKKDPNDKNKLIVDENVSEVIRNIFKWFIEGMPKLSIAHKLNELGIPCPSEYKKINGEKYVNANRLKSTVYWTHSTIHRALKSEFYIGNMVQRTQTTQSYKNKKNIQLSEKDWIIVEGTHEPIIDMDTWDKTQDLMKRDTRKPSFGGKVHVFAGYIKCADCKRAMHKKGSKGRPNQYYVCGTYKNYGVANCSSHSIREDELHNIVLQELNKYGSIAKEMDQIKEVMNTKKDTRASQNIFNIQIGKLERRKEQIFKSKQKVFEQYTEGVFSQEEFVQMKESYNEEEVSILSKLENIRDEKENHIASIETTNIFAEKFKKHAKIEKLDREILSEVLDVIYIHENKIVEIHWKYQNELLMQLDKMEAIS